MTSIGTRRHAFPLRAVTRPGASAWSASWLALPLLALPALWPLLGHGLPQGHDIPNHLMRLAAFDQQFQAGQWYPRWMPDLVLGYGYPLYNYYPPGSMFVAEAFRLIGLSYEQAFIGLFAVLLLTAALGMWRLAADFFPASSESQRGALALIAATAYLYAPYMLTNVYLRGAIAELGAQALLPWVLWSVRRLLRDERPARWLAPAAVSVAALGVMHNLSLLLVVPLLLALTALHLARASQPARRLAWAVAAGAAAVGLSAFYWWPLLGERGYLAGTFEQVARLWLPDNLWTWPGFLNPSFLFRYDLDSPYPLGLTQVILAVAGLWLARRWWQAEWLLLALAALGASVLIGRPWEPLWLGFSPLLIVQFPWRLLTLVSVVLALFTAGSVCAARSGPRRAVLAVALLGLIIVAQRPRLEGVVPPLPADLPVLGAAHVAQFERQTGSLGATTNFQGVTSDFMPRWVDQAYGLTTTPGADEHLPAEDIRLRVRAASATAMELSVSVARPSRLRFSTFYFPGWRVTLDGQQPLAPYPDTPLGLLTLDVPAGEHTLEVRWAGTPLQSVSTLITLLTLAALAVFAWRVARTKVMAGVLGGLALLGGSAWAVTGLARPAPVQPVEAPMAAGGLELAGYTYARSGERELVLRPYWFVRGPAADLQFYWRLTDAAGSTVAETRTRPFFDTLPATSWRSGTVVDDAYVVGLPGGLPAGDYTLAACAAADGACEPRRVGRVVLTRAVPAAVALPALSPVDARFGEALALAGYHLSADDSEALTVTANGTQVTAPGEALRYTFYWRALRPLPVDYHSFIHLADVDLNLAAGQDDMLGPAYWPPRLWDTHTWQPEVYELRLPGETPNGVYWPLVGVYDIATLERLDVQDAQGDQLGDSLRLPPVKVFTALTTVPAHASPARFEDVASLLGYDLALPAEGVRPGGTLTMTLYFRAEQGSARDLTRFVHLASGVQGLAAQADGPPQAGHNPTWAWVPGEVIVDTVVLTVDPQASAGTYSLRVGLYDLAAGGARLAVYGAGGQALPDNQVVVREVSVNP